MSAGQIELLPRAARLLASGMVLVLPFMWTSHAHMDEWQGGEVVLHLGPRRPLTEAVEILRPFDLSVGPDGCVLVADGGDNRIYKLAADGDLLWSVGRRGQGPGEFQMLYRVAVGPDGRVAALDYFPNTVSWFSSDGEFEQRVKLNVGFPSLDDMVVLDGDRIAISGAPASGPTHGVHVFSAQGELVTSFGSLFSAEDEQARRFWGAGGLETTASGTLLFTPKIPYEIHHFSPDGESLGSFAGPYSFSKGPDDAFVITRSSSGRVTIARSDDFVPFATRAVDLGQGHVLAGVREEQDVWIRHVFRDGQIVQTLPPDADLGYVAGVDRARRVLYVSVTLPDGNSGYSVVPFALETRR